MISFADARPQHLPLYDLDELSDRLAERAAEWVPAIFRHGRNIGGQLRLANIAGDPPRRSGSCVVALKGPNAGCWYDHSTAHGGGPLSTLEHATGLRGRDLFAKAAEIVGLSPMAGTRRSHGPISRPASQPRPSSSHQHNPASEPILSATALWIQRELDRSVPLLGSRGELYFKARGVPPPRSEDFRFSEGLVDHQGMRHRPGVIALLGTPEGRLLPAVHRTFLRDDCCAKADMPKPKKLLGPSRGGVIRLTPMSPEGVLGLAEGVENSLTAALFFNVPCWSAISAGGIRIFAEALARGQPPGLKRLRIFADRGPDGEDAAEFLRCEAERLGIAAQVSLPLGGDDFNKDLLQGLWPAPGIELPVPDNVDVERYVSREDHESEVEQALDDFYRRHDP